MQCGSPWNNRLLYITCDRKCNRTDANHIRFSDFINSTVTWFGLRRNMSTCKQSPKFFNGEFTGCNRNCRGLCKETHRLALFDHLRSSNIHVYCLQETHSTANDETNWTAEWDSTGALFHSNGKGDGTNGVAILLNHPNLAIISWHSDNEGRILTADSSLRSEIFHLTNIHAPQSGYTVQFRLQFFDSLYCYIYSPHPTIFTGDFNMVENPSLDRDPPSTTNDPT